MKYSIIRLPNLIEYGEGNTKTLHRYNEFITDKGKFQANGFNLREEDFEEHGLRDVDDNKVSVFPARFTDEYGDITTGPQTLSRKDIGHIITYTGLTKTSNVLDAGAGSGALALYLANIAETVITVDVDQDNVDLVRDNKKRLNTDNLTVKHADITDKHRIASSAFDVVTLDMPHPWEALPTVREALRIGGYTAVYTPHISQAQRVVNDAPQALHHEDTVEVTATTWDVGEKRLRPSTQGVDHTGFLTFLRCIDT
jgi:tRNA (adenine57-N1/adenine58-N1)-methyltransferase